MFELEFKTDTYEAFVGGRQQYGYIIVIVDPIYADTRFDAYNAAGCLQTYGDEKVIEDVTIDSVWFIGDDGEEFELAEQDLKQFYIDKEDLITKAQEVSE